MRLLYGLAILATLVSPAAAGQIDTVAGTGKKELDKFSGAATEVNIGQPFGVEVGPKGALFVCEVENHRVLRIDLQSGQATTVAGNGKKGYAGDGGPATEAMLIEPYEVRFDLAGNMFVVDMVGAVVRKVDAKTGNISTVAGTGKPGYGGDGGDAREAQLKQPHSIALDDRGSLYIADIGNHRIRRVDLLAGKIQTVLGTGKAELPADGVTASNQVPIRGPRALHVKDGTMWIALREGNSVWSLDLKTRKLAHVAGTGKKGYSGDGGPGKGATFNGPKGIVAGPHHDVYVMDTENQVARKIDLASGKISTVAGSGPNGRGYGGDGGPATESKMDRPHGITIDKTGVLYIGDTNNHRVRRVQP